MKLAYVDSCVWITLVEGLGAYRPPIRAALARTVFADALSFAAGEGLQAMDAVHCAIAEHHGCGRFVTTDPHVRGLKAITPEWIALGEG